LGSGAIRLALEARRDFRDADPDDRPPRFFLVDAAGGASSMNLALAFALGFLLALLPVWISLRILFSYVEFRWPWTLYASCVMDILRQARWWVYHAVRG
jgi:hypothetical protein